MSVIFVEDGYTSVSVTIFLVLHQLDLVVKKIKMRRKNMGKEYRTLEIKRLEYFLPRKFCMSKSIRILFRGNYLNDTN